MTTKLAQRLHNGEKTTLVVYGTSLSYHLAPHLRDALTERFGESITLVNSGLSGKASRTGLTELDNKVLKHSPDTLLVEFAVNDAYRFDDGVFDQAISTEESRANLETLIDRVLAALPGCEIIVQTMNPAYDSSRSPSRSASLRPDLGDYYQGYREVASARGLRLIDNYAMWKALYEEDSSRFEELVPDGVHPTPKAIRTVLVPHLLVELGFSPQPV